MQILPAYRAAFDAALAGDTRGILILLLAISGASTLGSLVYQIRVARWPSTRGTLLDSRTRKAGASVALHEQDYVNEVRYRYRVGDREYEGTRLSPWVVVASHNARGVLEMQRGQANPGDEIKVYFNPRNPARAFLKKPGVVGMVVTIAGALLLISLPLLVFNT